MTLRRTETVLAGICGGWLAVASASNAQSNELKPPFPQVNRHLRSKYCEIEYTANKKKDARQLAADADDSLDSMSRQLTPLYLT